MLVQFLMLPVFPVFARKSEPDDQWMTPPLEPSSSIEPQRNHDAHDGHLTDVDPRMDPPWLYLPGVSGQVNFFFSGHPTDLYSGVGLSGHLHLSQVLSISIDLRIGGGMDRDDDFYMHTLGSIGGSVHYWFNGNRAESMIQPYFKLGAGRMKLWDEHFNDGSENNDDWDWDKKSGNLKKNGEPAPGHSALYTEGALGVRFVLVPNSWYILWGLAFDVELGLIQDHHYGFGDSGLKFTFGFSAFF